MRRLRLHYRIVIPFVLVALLAIFSAVEVSYFLIRRVLQDRVESQVARTVLVVSRSDFALNSAILRSVKDITGADLITHTTDGTILTSTVDPLQQASLARTIVGSPASARALQSAGGEPIVAYLSCEGVPCYAAYKRVSGRPDAVVAVVGSMAAAAAATRTIARTIVLAAIASLLAVAVVGQVIARRVTAPVDRLVDFTRDVSAGAKGRRAPEGEDELGRLGSAFNQMLDRLDTSQVALVRSEKLALAGLLAARIAHDIRNPLSSMKIQAQLIRAHLRGDTESQTALAAILNDVEQIESVIRDLLELARPGELNLQPVQLNDVIRNAIRQLRPQLTYRKIRIDTDFAIDAKVNVDVNRFKQALLNIVINGAEAMVDGGTLVIETHPGPDSTVAVDVCDDGVGIDPGLLDRVFDPFVSTKRKGVGLGLVNARAIVESHGGRIELAPLEPRGTRARILLPLADG